MPKVLDSSTVTVPSLPTLSMASARTSPIAVSAAEMDATWAISSAESISLACFLMDSTAAATAFSMPRLSAMRVGAGGHVAQALVDEGLGQHGGGGGAVAGDVVGLGGDLLDQLGAHVLEGVLELDLAGDGHAVVGDGGRAELLVEDDVAALGAEGHLDGVGELVDAGLEAAAGGLVELQDLGHVAATYLADLGQHVAAGEDQQVLAVDGDLGAAVLGVDDGVADLDVERDQLAGVLGATAGADGEDLALLGLLLGGVGDDQARGGGLLGLAGADDDAVVEGLQTSWWSGLLWHVLALEP